MASDIVGRTAELGAIASFVDRLARGPAAMVIEGRPGIGKTTVWRQGVERAAERSVNVLQCRAVEAEAKLAFASLADLLESVADTLLPALAEPQRLALAIALMRASPPGADPSARAVATAVTSALRLLAASSPTLIAIDDAQWLDRASAEALAFALRRLGAHPVSVLTTMRVEDSGAPDPLRLEAAFAERTERIRLGPLSLSALHHIIRAELDAVLPRPTLRRIEETSAGNPLFALELARALIETGVQPVPGQPLPVPDTLSRLMQQRVERLPAKARAALLVASALASPTIAVLRRVLGGDGDAAIAQCERARLIEVRDGCIRFAHPLHASAVYASAPIEKRRDLHRRLTDVVSEPEERVRHLALAAAQPDAHVARALDDASLRARRRGAPDAAGELQEQAVRLTPPADTTSVWRRRTQAAEYFFHAGDRARARTLLEGVLAEDPAPSERVPVLHLLGQIRAQEDSLADALRYLEEALAHASDEAAGVGIRLDLAFVRYSAGDLTGAVTCARESLDAAERLAAPALIACALSTVSVGEFLLGHGINHASIERALALEDRGRGGQLMLRPTSVAGILAIYEGQIARAEALLREMCAWATERGEETDLPFLLVNLSWMEWSRGNFVAATAYAEEALALAVQSGSDTMRAVALMHRSRARGALGSVASAEADLRESGMLMEQTGYVQALPWLWASQATLELSRGDAAAAARTLAPLIAAVEARGIPEPIASFFVPDAIEALIHEGQLARAESLLQELGRHATERDRPWAMATVPRCRSLLAAAHGNLDVALAEAEEAVERGDQLEMPIDLGRALIALGTVRRRRGERRAARDALERATSLFSDLRAPLWTERANAELRRVPIRRATSPDELTPTEEQVAALAAAGRTNREVARVLHMSPKTVEANLTRIYGKLGIRSRAELGARMAERRGAASPVKK